MVLKFVAFSITVLFASVIIGGAIAATQDVTSNFPDFDSIINSNNVNPKSTASGQTSSPTLEGLVRIVGDAGSNSFNPNPIRIKVGETVTWVNEDDSSPHTATSTDGIFDSDMLQSGQSFSYTFDKEDEYPYYCMFHPNMVGTVIVS